MRRKRCVFFMTCLVWGTSHWNTWMQFTGLVRKGKAEPDPSSSALFLERPDWRFFTSSGSWRDPTPKWLSSRTWREATINCFSRHQSTRGHLEPGVKMVRSLFSRWISRSSRLRNWQTSVNCLSMLWALLLYSRLYANALPFEQKMDWSVQIWATRERPRADKEERCYCCWYWSCCVRHLTTIDLEICALIGTESRQQKLS